MLPEELYQRPLTWRENVQNIHISNQESSKNLTKDQSENLPQERNLRSAENQEFVQIFHTLNSIQDVSDQFQFLSLWLEPEDVQDTPLSEFTRTKLSEERELDLWSKLEDVSLILLD